MILKEIFDILPSSTKPVARLYQKLGETKLIFIGFKKDMVLAQHKSHLPAKLLVLNGNVSYIMAGETTILPQYESIDIPPDIMHEVHAMEDSLCLLTQGV